MNRKLALWKKLLLIIFIPLFIILLPVILLLYLIFIILFHLLAWLTWNTRGINTIYVYSNSPNWQEYIEQNILPGLPSKTIILNWSERKKWKLSLSGLAFHFFGGLKDFNPIAFVFNPFRPVKIFRFYQAFKDFKHGKCEPLKKIETEFLSQQVKQMKIHLIVTVLIICLSLFSGCAGLSPTASEKRSVFPVSKSDKTITFKDSMVWGDRPFEISRAIRFPKGKYVIEAEDNEYYYFRSPADIEYRMFKDKKVINARNMPGGLFFKKYFNMLPAGAYLSVSPREKVITWKLGGDFLNMEGKSWKRNF